MVDSRTVYVNSSAGNVSLTSPNGTLAIAGSNNAFTLDLAQQNASLNQVLAWNGTKYAPATLGGTVTNVSLGSPMALAFAITNPSTTPQINFANVGNFPNQVYLRGDGAWTSVDFPAGVQYLYQLLDVDLSNEISPAFTQLVTTGIRIVAIASNELTLQQTGSISPGNVFSANMIIAPSNNGAQFTVSSNPINFLLIIGHCPYQDLLPSVQVGWYQLVSMRAFGA